MKHYYVYIAFNLARTLYVGVTNDIQRRMYEHKNGLIEGFTSRYGIGRLAYYETTTDVRAAIAREKQIKGWLRAKKVGLVDSANPTWQDLSDGWFGESSAGARRFGRVLEDRPDSSPPLRSGSE